MLLENNWRRIFYTIWGGQAISLFTSAIVQYALVWYLTAETKSATVLSIAMLIGFLPMALFSPFIGSFVDRFDRKKIMMLSDGSIAVTTVILALIALSGHLPIWLIMLVLFIRAMGTCFHQPCLQAVTPLIVPEEQLAKCNGYTYSFQSISLIFSPAVAAALFAVAPLPWILMLDAVGAAAGVLTVAIVKVPKLILAEDRKLHVVRDAIEGLGVLRKARGLYLLVFISALFTIGMVPASSLYPLMCMDYFGGTTLHAGIAEMAFAIGMLIGGLVLGVWGGTKNKMITMAAAMAVMGLSLGATGFLPPSGFVMFTALTLVAGLTAPFFSTLFMTMLQEQIAPQYLGRVMSISASIMALAAPVGLAFSGLFAEKLGIENWFILSGIVTLLCVVLAVALKPVREADLKRVR